MQTSKHKKTIGGYPAFGVVLSITLTLLVIGVFGVLAMYAVQFERIIRENVNLKVYVKSQLSSTQLMQVRQTLVSQSFTAKADSAVRFTSREEAKRIMNKSIGNYDDILADNPYKDMFTVTVDPAYHSSKQLDSVSTELSKVNGVIDVKYEKDSLEDINDNFAKISLILLGIALLFIVVVVLLINSTLRIALFSQRFLIRSMQLVGAKNSFILRPFLVRAGLYGLLAGAIASGVLFGATHYLYEWFEGLRQAHEAMMFYSILLAITFFGIIIAILSTSFSIRRYLRMSLDELY